jgi:hypothetical protein
MNIQRENFGKKVAEHMKSSGGGERHGSGEGAGKSESRIEHHGDGTHTIHHHDGETSGPHPSMAHAGMHMAGKHDGGEHGHIMPHAGGGATTHHVGMDGMVEGPHEHGSEEDGYDHLKQNIGDGADMMGEDGGQAPGGGEEDSSFE